eukprot:9484003-Pyramimonas_sp.AAC.1
MPSLTAADVSPQRPLSDEEMADTGQTVLPQRTIQPPSSSNVPVNAAIGCAPQLLLLPRGQDPCLAAFGCAANADQESPVPAAFGCAPHCAERLREVA